jgi:FkbM family methyltransferase
MKNLVVKIILFFLREIIGKQNVEKGILFVSRLLNIDLLMLAYQNLGILKYQDIFVSGEHFVISKFLKPHIKKEEEAILFDVGANVGIYSKELRANFPKSKIYAFEPNGNAFEVMKKNLEEENIQCFNIGFSSQAQKTKIYTYAHDNASDHGSLHKEVLLVLHKAEKIIEIELELSTIDEFCNFHSIEYIDFLKIDTEGHELAVLNGAQRMIESNKIGIIQFEFNEMNIISRVFLKDFYNILSGYNIYRLDSNRLIPLGEYNSINEIFKFQNILAVNKKL